MRLPFAVYTAYDGYGWAAGLTHGRATLERLRRAVGKTPDFDYGAPPCCGTVSDGDTVAVYRFMRAERWDSKGRNATYLALSYFPRASAKDVDVERLLAFEPFRVPLREPPEWLEYDGPGADASGFDPETEESSGAALDLSCVGSVFMKPFAGQLLVRRDEGAASCRVTYRRLQPVLNEPAPPPATNVVLRETEEYATSATPAPARRGLRVFAHAVLVAAALALFVGGVYWRATRCGTSGAIVAPVCENTGRGGRCGDDYLWLFDADGHWQGLTGCLMPLEGKDGRDD
jgi:hypothetical protein